MKKSITPRMGPMIGETSMEATINTLVLVASPPAAMNEAPDSGNNRRKRQVEEKYDM